MDGGVDSPIIRPINKASVHRICSGQVILDLAAAVKELVENSLDAGASSIEISLKEYGEDSFKVTDNGCGISPNNFQTLAHKHHTSKIADFPDLQSLTTFGFRGEALSSLCALGNLTVETRTKNEPVGTHLTFDHSGLVKSERKTARQIGTTVTVEKLFSSLSVRRKEFSRNIRKEYAKLISVLHEYALIAKGVRLVCTNTTRKNNSVVLKTPGSSSLKDNVITVLGLNTLACLEPVNLCISDSCKVEGFLSKSGHGSGRNLGDRQFFYVNGRPVDMPKVTKLINELYKSANSRQYPIAIMNFTIPTNAYDVNVTPDKRKIFFSDESSLMVCLREAIEGIYSPSQCTYSINRIDEPKKETDTIVMDAPDDEPLSSPHLLSPQGISQEQTVHTQELNAGDISDNILVKERSVQDYSYSGEGIVCINKESSLLKNINGSGSGSEKSEKNSIYQPKKLKTLSISMTSTDDLSSFNVRTVQNDSARHVLNVPIDKLATPNVKKAENDTSRNVGSTCRSKFVQSSLTKFVALSKRKHENSCTTLSELPILRKEMAPCQVRKTNSVMHAAGSKSHVTCNIVDDSSEADEDEHSDHCGALRATGEKDDPLSDGSGVDDNKVEEEDLISEDKASSPPRMSSKVLPDRDLENTLDDTRTDSLSRSCDVAFDAPMPSSGFDICSVLQFSISDLRKRRTHGMPILYSSSDRHERMKTKRCYAAATLDNSQPENEEGKANALAAATTELERFFKKEDFGRMKVIGQFNLGFIIGKIDQDLFIVDQHAADEKYNFERLSQSTIMNQQPLIQPLRLELSPEEEVIASLQMEIIRKNGFTLIEDVHAPPGHRFLLKAVPFSKNILFGAEDVKELISTLSDKQGECLTISSYKMDTQDSICPFRVRAMLASRACRSSVMIGDPLDRNEMQKILKHLVGLKSPWNCPHGRPTMRHLIDLTTVRRRYGQKM